MPRRRTTDIDPWREREIELVTRSKAGDAEAFGELYTHYESQMRAHAYKRMGDYDEAEDMTQDALIKAWQAISRTTEDLNVAAWFFRITDNCCLDALRRRARIRFQPWEIAYHDHLLPSSPNEDPERVAVASETRVMVRRVLMGMSERHRWALILRELHDMSCRDVGAVMDLSRSATKSLLYRSREEFRRVFSQLYPDRRLDELPVMKIKRRGEVDLAA